MIKYAMFGLGIGELVVVLAIVLIVFGAGRLPEVMGSLGKGIQSFRRALKEPPEIDVTPAERHEGETPSAPETTGTAAKKQA